MSGNRLDQELLTRGLAKSREYARKLIKNGNVTVNGKVITKPAFCISETDIPEITAEIYGYVGRGGLKLEKALKVFDVDLSGRTCLDIGASTGGFTDCMLQNGAKKVYALDVGHSQLDESLINDSRVVNMEKTNIRTADISLFDDVIDFIATDVSFISLKLVIPKIYELLCDNGEACVLIKPQFEAGKENISKNGIVKKPSVHKNILNDMILFSKENGMTPLGLDVSPVKGGSGNSEYLMYLKKNSEGNTVFFPDIDELVEKALKKE